MRIASAALRVVLAALVASASLAWAESEKQILVTPDAITWKPGPPSIPPGAEMVVLAGDPTKPGPYTVRVRFLDGYRLPPHVHPAEERATVLQGTLLVGFGERWDDAGAIVMPAGSFRVTPPGVPHYLRARGETIFQVDGVGPAGITYIDPADDPRRH